MVSSCSTATVHEPDKNSLENDKGDTYNSLTKLASSVKIVSCILSKGKTKKEK